MPILLYYMEDYSVSQIAQTMECNESTIKSRLSAGRKQIKQEVLALEKQGVKLYCVPLVPFLFWMFHTPATAAVISAASAGTAAAATGLSLAAKIGIVAALVACVGGGAAAGYVVTSNNYQGDSDTGIEVVSADWESEEPGPAPQNIVYEYDEIGDDFYEEHNNILGIMWGLMEASEKTDYYYESDDTSLIWYPIYEYVGRYWPELDGGTGTIFMDTMLT